MSNDQSEWWYLPPAGALYDFDDDSLVHGPDRAGAKRWLAGFNGRVGEPAENVQLAWRSPSGARVAIGTFQPLTRDDRTTHRLTAARMLDSVQFYQPGPPATPTLRGMDHLQEISQDDSLWLGANLQIDAGHVPISVTTVAGVTIAHTEDGSVVVVSVGIPPDQLRVRSVPQPATGYLTDPWQPQTVTALNSEWDAFFRDRPDLVPA